MNRKTVLEFDGFSRRLLTALVALLSVIAVELWVLRPGGPAAARAQIPDTALQRQNIVEETKRTNALLEQILDHLKSKPIRVTFGADEKKRMERPEPVPRGR